MTRVRLTVGSIWLGMLLFGLAIWKVSATPPSLPVPPGYITAVPGNISARPAVWDPASEQRLDLYGNPVDEAIGDYRVDPKGELYERHSPDTAVLKLVPPDV